jgi:hypothetical protein
MLSPAISTSEKSAGRLDIRHSARKLVAEISLKTKKKVSRGVVF